MPSSRISASFTVAAPLARIWSAVSTLTPNGSGAASSEKRGAVTTMSGSVTGVWARSVEGEQASASGSAARRMDLEAVMRSHTCQDPDQLPRRSSGRHNRAFR